jgi:hypothetical protein
VTYQCDGLAVDLFAADSDDDDEEDETAEGKDRRRNEEVACLMYPNALLGPSAINVSSSILHDVYSTTVDDELINVEF